MKKLLLTLIVLLAFNASIFAQYESHWPAVQLLEDQGGLCAAISIDGKVYTVEDEGWDALELGIFVGEDLRGKAFLNRENVDVFGDPYPITNGTAIQYENSGETVTFILYNHLNETEYTIWESTYLDNPITILTGEDHLEAWTDEPYAPIIINFTSPTPAGYTTDILGYEGETDHYYLIASPIGEVNPTEVTNMTENEFDLYAFDQSQNAEEWQNYETTEFTLEPGKGYLYANNNDVTLTFNGAAYEGSGEVTLTKDDNANLSGWNLIGNPFTETAYIDRDFYTMNADGSEIVAAETTAIEAMRGVFVIAETDGETVTFSTTAPDKKGASLALNLSQNRGNVIDRAIVRFDEGRNLPKLQLRSNSSSLYFPQNGNDYAVVRSEKMGELPLNFKTYNAGTYTISLSKDAAEFSYLHLIDNMTGADVDLLESQSYSFEANASDNASRFKLVFATGSSNEGESFGFVSNGQLMIYGIEGEATLKVMDLKGRTLSTESFNGSYNKQLNLSSGVYMLQLIQGSEVKTQKIVL